MHYNRLVALVMTVNLGWAVYGATAADWWTSDGTDLGAVALTAQTISPPPCLSAAVHPQCVGVAGTRPPTSWPLRVRWTLGKYYHFGGLHVGAAVAGTLWYMALVVSLIRDAVAGVGEASHAHMILGITIATTFTVMVVMALPRLRAAQHDRFEVTHRFCGWAALVLVWINTMLFVNGDRGDRSFGSALLTAPAFWLVVLTALLAIWPWLLLRRVPISWERPSSHAVILRLDHGVIPAIGTTRPISRRPFVGWHHFANVPAAPGATGYRMLVSRAGDWTSAFVDEPPTHVWVRGIPTVGVANVRRLFTKVVLVATGSGIGPVLGHLLDTSVPSRLVWVTKNPRHTYGDAFIDEIEAAQPDAMIGHRRARQARCAATGLCRVRRIGCRGGHLRLQPYRHLARRARPGAVRDTGVRPDLGFLSDVRHCLCTRWDQGVRRGVARRYDVRQVQHLAPARQGRDG